MQGQGQQSQKDEIFMNQRDIDRLMTELDQKEMGFLGYEDFIYGLLPK